MSPEFAEFMKKIFIAATQQNDGKTTASLGLVCNFQRRFKGVGFIKPIGQRYLEEDGLKFDEDSLLLEEVCGIKGGIKDMSPIAVERGFTENYIVRPDAAAISRRIKDAFRRVSKSRDLVIIEGTGHAGVGSVFDHSNAAVAKMLGSKAVIISSGGVGRPIDEIVLNKALFDKEGVKVIGVIINKVLPEKLDKVKALVKKGLERKGIKVLGVLPYEPSLSYPSIEQILEENDFELLCGREFIEVYIRKIIVGTMTPRNIIRYLDDDSLLITSGDREDVIMTALGCVREGEKDKLRISGIILSGGIIPDQSIMELLSRARIPVLLAKTDTYNVASRIHDMTVKIRPRDKHKIQEVVKLIKDHVDMEGILKGM
ncbi:MAG: AAA family ATPase [Candidatus Omnitrophica bacterium]|jgi:BioD-like phosphotransacetylase family protein|nr:AAA family ATPase [Candidatus Omnitrophota bacterium]